VSEFLVVTGMSGAGRSSAAATLEDLGWFVIDNLPVALIGKVAELVARPGPEDVRVTLVVGRGGEQHDDVLAELDALSAAGHRVRVLFLDAPDDVLVRRFEGTRRRHPLTGHGVEEAIADERRLLAPLRDRADVVIDTGDLNTNQLRARIRELFAADADRAMKTSIVSFGYSYGLPMDVDLVFDCRFLPNPYWSEELRPFSGLDPDVRDFVLSQPDAAPFLDQVVAMLVSLVPSFSREGKSYLSIALGCTGGRHRSVALAAALAERLRECGIATTVFHRDIDR
jgi:UPF0042 nucleotide-binding protein